MLDRSQSRAHSQKFFWVAVAGEKLVTHENAINGWHYFLLVFSIVIEDTFQ